MKNPSVLGSTRKFWKQYVLGEEVPTAGGHAGSESIQRSFRKPGQWRSDARLAAEHSACSSLSYREHDATIAFRATDHPSHRTCRSVERRSVTLTGCAGDGQLGFLGYTTAPNYDPEIRSVYVPIFKTRFFETSPYRGVEFTLTRAVVDAIELRTPMKVISDPARADTELQGSVLSITKLDYNRTPYNEAREVQHFLGVEIVWHDLRPGHEGKVLTNPRRRDPLAPPVDPAFDPGTPPPQITADTPQPTVLTTMGRALRNWANPPRPDCRWRSIAWPCRSCRRWKRNGEVQHSGS